MNKKLYDTLIAREESFDNGDFFFVYNGNMTFMKKIYRELYDKTSEIILRGRYNYASPIIIYLRDTSQDNIIPLYKNALISLGKNIDDIFISYYAKCSKETLNDDAFEREAVRFKGCTFLLHDFDEIPFDLENYVAIDYELIVNANEEEATNGLKDILSELL